MKFKCSDSALYYASQCRMSENANFVTYMYVQCINILPCKYNNWLNYTNISKACCHPYMPSLVQIDKQGKYHYVYLLWCTVLMDHVHIYIHTIHDMFVFWPECALSCDLLLVTTSQTFITYYEKIDGKTPCLY